MNTDKEKVWDRLKHGLPFRKTMTATIHYTGNGIATRFNSAWLSNPNNQVEASLDGVLEKDFIIQLNDLVFTEPPAEGAKIQINVFTK